MMKAEPLLGPTAQAILQFIADYHKRHSLPPSVRDIGKALRLSSGNVQYHIEHLVALGKLRRFSHSHRSLVLTERQSSE